MNISAADLLQANTTVAELRSKGFTASDVLNAGASCAEVEREYGKQPAKCGNSTGLIVAIVVVVLILGVAIGGLAWVPHQKGSSQPIDKGRRDTRSRKQQQQQQQHGDVMENPMCLKDERLDEDSSNASYGFATEDSSNAAYDFAAEDSSNAAYGFVTEDSSNAAYNFATNALTPGGSRSGAAACIDNGYLQVGGADAKTATLRASQEGLIYDIPMVGAGADANNFYNIVFSGAGGIRQKPAAARNSRIRVEYGG
jgi:hypothetical protein